MSPEPSFLCTFCWTPQFPPSKPKVLGRESRIACLNCWRSVLDLSICWVCGEVIVRGEEVVSLGWCFWHRGCFGCLICGMRLEPPRMTDGEDGNELQRILKGGLDGKGGAGGRCTGGGEKEWSQQRRGVELVRIRLCSWCEVSTEGLCDAEIVENGIRNVTRNDGGMSRTRFETLQRSKPGSTPLHWQTRRTPVKGQTQTRDNEPKPEVGKSLPRDMGQIGGGFEGKADESSKYSSPPDFRSSMPAPFYVSVLDPVGGPSFQAGQTKPLPKWMTLLPSNRKTTLEREAIASRCPESHSYRLDLMPNIAEKSSNIPTNQDTTATMQKVHTHYTNSHAGDTSLDTAASFKSEEPDISEPSILDDTEVGVPNFDILANYQASRLQRKDTSYPFMGAVYHPILNLGISGPSSPPPSSSTSMPTRKLRTNEDFIITFPSQIATPILSLDGTLKRRRLFREQEPISDLYKRQKTEGAALTEVEKNDTSERHEIPRNPEVRNELKRTLLKWSNRRREPL